MNHHKFSAWIVAGVCLMVLAGLARLSGATVQSAAAQLPLQVTPPTEMGIAAPHALGDPTSITKDADGYTIWTYEYLSRWCVPYSRIRWPFNLDTQDPTKLGEATLKLTFSEMPYYYNEGAPYYVDSTWAVALNGDPGPWGENGFTGEWNIIGAIGTTPTEPDEVPVTQEIHFDSTGLIDGENNLWFQQQDFCGCSGLADCACTCYDLDKLELRVRPDLAIQEVSPEPDARNVSAAQTKDSEIQVTFTPPVSPTSVTPETFQLFYYDQDLNRVTVEGAVRQLSDTRFAFVPAQPLKDGIRYEVQVWDEAEANSHGHDQWVHDLLDGPLETGRIWSFWTLPKVEVNLTPVQVVEGVPFILNKPTLLRTFIRWDTQPDVFELDQVAELEVDDIVLAWTALDGSQSGQAHWNGDDYGWRPARDATTTLRKREYREFNTARDSYDKFDKQAGRDSVNYFGFMPLETGSYLLSVQVLVRDNQDRIQKLPLFPATTSLQVVASRQFGLYVRAIAVGSDYTKTGTIDLSAAVKESVDTLKALYPAPSVTRPPAASALAYYSPTTTLWLFNWATEPAWSLPKKYLLQEMSGLCAMTTGCDAMVGFVPQTWLVAAGLSLPESAPQGALVQHDTTEHFRFLVAHEIGHIYGFEHDTLTGGEGYEVSQRQDKRYSVSQLPPRTQKTLNVINNFMNIDPVESPPPERLWIGNMSYTALLSRLTGSLLPRTQAVATADQLLLATGIITEANGAVQLWPWYQLAPGAWTPPTPGPYQIVFLDTAGQPLAGYTQPFTVSLDGDPAFFTLKVPYPTDTAKVQIRRIADDAVLAEITPAANPPTVTIQPASPIWRGPQTLTWQSDPGARYFAVAVSTDNGATWEALALNLTAPTYTLQTTALPNTPEALIRIAASDGLRTATATAGPFTLDNPPLVGYVDPPDGAEGVGVWTSAAAGFRDAMLPTSIHSRTFTLAGGPFGSVLGKVAYDTATHEVTLTPTVPLAYATRYTATLTTGVQGVNGENLPVTRTWTFTTEIDGAPPSPIAFSPQEGATNVPRNAVLAVAWDRALNASTLNTSTFALATAAGTPVSGVVSYDDDARTATFAPAAGLLTDTLYIATLKVGIVSADGYTTTGDFNWAFTGGRMPDDALAFTGGYADWGQDTAGADAGGDGLYEQLIVRVGVQVTATGDFILRGSLADADGSEITWAYITRTLPAGAHFLDLSFDGAAIGGHGADGPYTLTDLTLTHIDGMSFQVLASTAQRDAYRTFAYPAARFLAPLRFGGLPDVQIIPGTTILNAFNVQEYAQHVTRTSAQLSYTVMFNTQPAMSVTLQLSGRLLLSPDLYWQGRTAVTIRASDGVYAVQDTFAATVGWPVAVYLPVVLRRNGAPISRDGWVMLIKDDFESGSFGWSRASWYSAPYERFYHWENRDCRAYSGQHSAWAYGYASDGTPVPCGATYPDTLGTRMYQGPVNLKYVAKAEYSAKVWTNLAPGDKVCLQVAPDPSDNHCQGATYYDSVCRSGQTNGWEDLTLDLSNVPTLGNLLGKEEVCVAVVFQANEAETRPEGAYVDDVQLQICPAGLAAYCPGSAQTMPTTPTLAAGAIGGYPESIGEAALAVDAGGRIYALWNGQLNPNFETYVFYSTSTDGVNWTPYQILSYWDGKNPQIAVDNVHGRVYLVYHNGDGIIRHTVVNGVVSAPEVVVPYQEHYAPGWDTFIGNILWPKLAVAEDSGYAYLVWQEPYSVRLNSITYSLRLRTWHAYWDGVTWSAPQREINDQDTDDSTIVATPDGRTMLAWFQRWEQSSGGGTGSGDPIVARTAYGTDPGSFPLRQATHALYTTPERDESILLAYAGGADAFVLMSNHAMWPGHSLAYRYVWKDGVWSEPLNVAENASGWATPYYVGAATNTPLIRYVYGDNDVMKMRTETNGVLGAAQTVAAYLTAHGYSGSPLAYFTDAAGNLHMIVSGEKDGVSGFYYVQP